MKPTVTAKIHVPLSDPIVQLNVLRRMETLQHLQLGASEQSVEPFIKQLANRLVSIHQFLGRQSLLGADLVHFEYSSLVARASLGLDYDTDVRKVFSPIKSNRDSTAIKLFAEEVNYDPGRDILPKVDCKFCSLLFVPDAEHADESYIDKGIYPINGLGFNLLVKILKQVQLHPWRLKPEERKRAFVEFSKSQGALAIKWNKTHKSLVRKRILPDFSGIFDFALVSAIRTMLLLSDELFDMYANFPLCSDVRNCPPGQRRGTTNSQQFHRLRSRALEEISYSKSRAALSRSLMFVPIRMPISDGSKAFLETIGLVAYYSNDPVELNTAEALAVMEHLIFMTCRQYEGFKLRNQIGERLGTLEIQRIFARLLAHEATKPLAGIKDFMDSVEEATRQSRESLGKFARGEIEALQRKRRVDLFEIMAGVKRLRATRMDGLHVRYEEDVSPGTYVFGDRDAVKYSLGVLLDNAIDHGDGQVRVWTKGKSNGRERKRHVIVCVANNGAPMAPRLEEAIKAGQPPLRAVKRRANQGVGLHLAYEFARLNKWKLLYQRVGDDPRELIHVFELWLPKAPSSE